MIKINCSNCNNELWRRNSSIRSDKVFCNKSCATSYRNKIDNPSWYRDLSGENNPMYGKNTTAWNKGIKGELCHNWKGGLSRRKDGYFRINIDGKRKLYHRYLLEKNGEDLTEKVVHHKNGNPSDNRLDNLMVFNNQSEHVKYEYARTNN